MGLGMGIGKCGGVAKMSARAWHGIMQPDCHSLISNRGAESIQAASETMICKPQFRPHATPAIAQGFYRRRSAIAARFEASLVDYVSIIALASLPHRSRHGGPASLGRVNA